MPPAPLPVSTQAQRTPDSPISYYVQKALDTPGLISLAAGLVDEPSLPAREVADAVAAILADPKTAQAALQYGSTQGYGPLREQVLTLVCEADGVAPAEVGLSAKDVLLGSGSQQLLYLVGEALLDPGDLVITEAPSYFVFHSCLGSLGATVLPVPMDEHGMDTDALERLLVQLDRTGRLPKLKMIYTVDYFQNPTGLSLSEPRRAKLVELARRFSTKQRIVILEDAAYRELRYDGPDRPSVKRFDPANEFVVYTSTFSKPCAPGLKTGYAIAPGDLVGTLCHLKGNHDFGSGNLAQHVVSKLIETGDYHRHVETLRGVYGRKRDLTLRSLRAEFADWDAVTWTRADGGLYVWLTFPPGFDAGAKSRFSARCFEEGVMCVPGEFCHVASDGSPVPRNEVRICFGVASDGQIAEGIRRFRRACVGMEGAAKQKGVAVGAQ